MSKGRNALITSLITSLIFFVIILILTRDFSITFFGTVLLFAISFISRYLDAKRKEKLDQTYDKYSNEDEDQQKRF